MTISVESRSLTLEEMTVNAQYILTYLLARGWTKNAVCGMLGNIQVESSINPARWEGDNVGDLSHGYGLVQWTPATNFINWCNAEGLDRLEMDSALKRILYEVANGVQWYSTSPMSFEEFTHSTESPEYLGRLFGQKYERYAGYDTNPQIIRESYARYWYDTIGGGGVVFPPSNKVKDYITFTLCGTLK